MLLPFTVHKIESYLFVSFFLIVIRTKLTFGPSGRIILILILLLTSNFMPTVYWFAKLKLFFLIGYESSETGDGQVTSRKSVYKTIYLYGNKVSVRGITVVRVHGIFTLVTPNRIIAPLWSYTYICNNNDGGNNGATKRAYKTISLTRVKSMLNIYDLFNP